MSKVRMGVLGCGYWGPNHIRTFSALRNEGVEMAVAADLDAGRRQHIAQLYPWVRLVEDANEVVEDPDIDAVVVATPVATHYPLALKALQAGKHVLVEKPFVTEIEQADELVSLAKAKGKTLMVGHTFEYTAAVNRIRDIVASGELGDVLYVRSLRVNLGLFQKDINVVWDLAPHDISILLYVLQRQPTAVSAVGSAHITPGIEDVVTLNLEFGELCMATIIVSWLDPRKVREMTLVGDKKMLVYDDISANEKIKIFDKRVEKPRHYDSFGEFQYAYRYGDIVTPMLQEHEPLRAEDAHFIECIKTGAEPRSSGARASQVTRILNGAAQSLREDGRKIELEPMLAR